MQVQCAPCVCACLLCSMSAAEPELRCEHQCVWLQVRCCTQSGLQGQVAQTHCDQICLPSRSVDDAGRSGYDWMSAQQSSHTTMRSAPSSTFRDGACVTRNTYGGTTKQPYMPRQAPSSMHRVVPKRSGGAIHVSLGSKDSIQIETHSNRKSITHRVTINIPTTQP